MSDAQLAKMEGWFKQLNKKIDHGLAKLSAKLDHKVDKDDFDLKFDRLWREMDRISSQLENYQDSIRIDMKLLKRQVIKMGEELEALKA